MNQKQAFADTLKLAEQRGMPERSGTSLGLEHLREMNKTVQQGRFSPSKLGRWLGWAQCAVVAADIGVTLDDMKQINMRLTEDGEHVTRDGIEVKRGQIWQDCDKRAEGATVTVLSVADGKARIDRGVTKTLISVSRMYPHSSGFKLIRDV